MILVQRGATTAFTILAGVTTFLAGQFWTGLRNASIDCNPNTPGPKQPNQNGITCAVDVVQTAVTGVACGLSVYLAVVTFFTPSPKRSLEDLHPMLQSGRYTHVAYREPGSDGYHRLYYLNDPVKPSNIRLNLNDRGIHTSDIGKPDIIYHHLRNLKRETEEERWVDVDDAGIFDNSFVDPDWAKDTTSAKTVTADMLNYMAEKGQDTGCFHLQVNTTSVVGGALLLIGPSRNNATGLAPELVDCGEDLSPYTIKVA